MAHVKGIELEEYTLKLMERFGHLYNGVVSGELHKGYSIEHHMFYLVWNDMPWIEFGIVTPERGEVGDWELYALPIYGRHLFYPNDICLKHAWDKWDLSYEADESEYALSLSGGIESFLKWYIDEVSEPPRQKYFLEMESEDRYRVIMSGDRHPEAKHKAGGIVDGPGVLPHWGSSWIDGTSTVTGVRLGANTLVQKGSVVTVQPGADELVRVEADFINSSTLNLGELSSIGGVHLSDANISGQVTIHSRVFIGESTIRPAAAWGKVKIPGGVSIMYADLVANASGNLPVVSVGPIGSESGRLTVFLDKYGKTHARRGCFHGTVENFLKDNEKAHKDKRPEVYEIYHDLLPILEQQVRKVANDTPEYDEDEE